MTTSQGILLAALVLASLVLTTGCTTSSSVPAPVSEHEYTPALPALPITTSLPDTPLVPNQCLDENTSSYIGINSVPPHYLGDSITFQGTTNLPPGEMIEAAVYSGYFIPCAKSTGSCLGKVTPCCGGYGVLVPVLAGTCGINTWSWDVNTSEHGFEENSEYVLSVSGRTNAVQNSSIFTLEHRGPYLVLNLPSYDPATQIVMLSGEVRNGTPDPLLITVASDSGKIVNARVPVQHNGTGDYWHYAFLKSAILPFNFYTVSVSSAANPAISISRVFDYNSGPEYYPYRPSGP